MKIRNNEEALKVYRTLIYFYEKKLPVHFKLKDDTWRNGEILDLSEQKLTLVLREFVNGIEPHMLEEIKPNTIKQYHRIKEITK